VADERLVRRYLRLLLGAALAAALLPPAGHMWVMLAVLVVNGFFLAR
jgi:hypothetical protein